MGGHGSQDLVARRVRRRRSTVPRCRPASGTGGRAPGWSSSSPSPRAAGCTASRCSTRCGRTCSSTTLRRGCTRRPTTRAGPWARRTPSCSVGEMVTLWPGGGGVVTDVEEFERCGRGGARRGRHRPRGAGPVRPTGATCCRTTCTSPGRRRTANGSRVCACELLRLTGRWEELVALDPADEEAHVALIRRSIEAGDRLGRPAPVRTPRAGPGVGARPQAGAGGPDPAHRAARERLRCAQPRSPRSSSRSAATPSSPRVDALLEQVARTGGRALFVVGPPGTGKTALLTSVLARARRRHLRTGLGRGGHRGGAVAVRARAGGARRPVPTASGPARRAAGLLPRGDRARPRRAAT